MSKMILPGYLNVWIPGTVPTGQPGEPSTGGAEEPTSRVGSRPCAGVTAAGWEGRGGEGRPSSALTLPVADQTQRSPAPPALPVGGAGIALLLGKWASQPRHRKLSLGSQEGKPGMKCIRLSIIPSSTWICEQLLHCLGRPAGDGMAGHLQTGVLFVVREVISSIERPSAGQSITFRNVDSANNGRAGYERDPSVSAVCSWVRFSRTGKTGPSALAE